MWLACLSLITITASSKNVVADTHRHKLVIFDTSERDEWLYKPFITILESVGFSVTYKPLDSLLDQTAAQMNIKKYPAALFIFGLEFLGGLRHSYFSAKMVEILEQYAQQKDSLIILAFPPLRGGEGINLVGACAPIFKALGIQTPADGKNFLFDTRNNNVHDFTEHINAFLHAANIFLGMPIESRPLNYHTTLNMPRGGTGFNYNLMNQLLSYKKQPLYLLPINDQSSDIIRPTLPYGLYWFNPIRHNHVLVTNTSLLTFSGVSENFHLCPTNFMLRKEMLSLVLRMMLESASLSCMNNAHDVQEAASKLSSAPVPQLPKNLDLLGSQDCNQRLTPGPRKIAWMEINAFYDPTAEETAKKPGIKDERKKQQQDMISYIFDSGLDSLWITINPHMYYSTIGRLKDPAHEQQFIQGLSQFTKALRDASVLEKKAPPKILLGYEITNNIYEPNLPKHYAIDLYENAYKDLPIPTDYSFWKDQIIDPLVVFMKKWNDPSLSHGVQLGGVVLDLEMYCRKKTGSFLTAMGFDNQTFSKFEKKMKLSWGTVALRDRVLKLMKARLCNDYFKFLEDEAQGIGSNMQQAFIKLIPGCHIVCYLPHVNVSWFYKGLYKGLSKKNYPLHLLTFNSEFFAHEKWFKKYHINAYHSSVLLLSKLEHEHDFSWVDYVLNNHHGVWLNRFSRFTEPKAADWTSVEQPRMHENLYPTFMQYLQQK